MRLILAAWLVVPIVAHGGEGKGRDFNIADFGAKPDAALCTEAFGRAFAAASSAGGGRVVVPAGTWATGAIHLKSNTELHLSDGAKVLFSQNPDDYLPAVETSWEGMECWNYSPLVYAYGCTNVAITGAGTLCAFEGDFDNTLWKTWVPAESGIRAARRQLYDWGAQGVPVAERQIWKKPNAHTRPHLLQLNRCKGVRLEGFKIRQSPFWTVHLYHSEDIVVRGLDVYAHGNNNDGIDIEMSRNVLVEACKFDQGDDGIVIKSGRNRDAWRLNRPTENVTVRHCTVVNGHGLLVVGSEISGGVKNVMISDCQAGNVYRAFYVKTNRRRGGTVENICMRNCQVKNVRVAAVCVETNVLYEWAKFPTYEEKLTTIRNLQVDNLQCEKVKYPVYLKGDRDAPVEGVHVNWLDVKQAEEASVVENVRGYVNVPKHEPNYDAAKIPPYTLESPLVFTNGEPVATMADWPKRRREILDIFAREMYGAEPPKPEVVNCTLEEEKVAAGGYAVRRRHRMTFRKDGSGPAVTWFSWVPRHAKRPCPVILWLNYRGAQELDADAAVPVSPGWSRNGALVRDHRVLEKSRGKLLDQNGASVFPLQTILARGYAVMTACYCEVSPDPERGEPQPALRQDPFAYTGVFALWGPRDAARTDNITSLGAWAWALSRGLDLAERLPGVDARRSVATGCSRLAKAALIAAARDERFAVCVPVQTGGGGCPLAKRDFGENTSTENSYFTHWYCSAYAQYAIEPWKTMPFDQHLLLAAIAPRALLICGYDSPWFDTEGEFLAAQAASPAWTLHGMKGLPNVAWPDDFDTSAIGPRLGYVRRSEEHGIAGHDWMWMLDFADRVWQDPHAPALGKDYPLPSHPRITAYDLMDQTDGHNELLRTREWTAQRNEGVFSTSCCAWDIRDLETGTGRVFLRLAPLPHARPVRCDDFYVDAVTQKLTVVSNGYPYLTRTYVGGRLGCLRAFHDLQRELRPYRPGRDGRILSNNWGGGYGDARLNADYAMREIEAGAQLGVDVVELDDGWQKGRSANSRLIKNRKKEGAWNGYWAFDPNFWDPDPTRFAQGLDPLVAAARMHGMDFGLWYGPDSSNDAANWERDADRILAYYRTSGIRYFKIDSMKSFSPLALSRQRAMFDKILAGSSSNVVFDLDVTAEIRPGYFGLPDIGTLFVENRYAKWCSWWPHQTLRNLWTLAHVVDPIRLRMEFLDPKQQADRYAEQFPKSPLRPEFWAGDAVFATVMLSSPLAWMEMQGLDPKTRTEMASLIAVWKREREKVHTGHTYPVGDKPDGFSWTGFVTVAADGRRCYVLLFREASPCADYVLDLTPFGQPASVRTLAGIGTSRLKEGRLAVSIPSKLGYLWLAVD